MEVVVLGGEMVGRDGFQPVGERERLQAEEVELVDEDDRVLIRGCIFAVRIAESSQVLATGLSRVLPYRRSSLVTECVMLSLQNVDQGDPGVMVTWK